jgi:hypothetical protein
MSAMRTLGYLALASLLAACGAPAGKPEPPRVVGVTSQREGVFEHWMSSLMTAPIVGSLAGNVLGQLRVELDYPEQKLYLSP